MKNIIVDAMNNTLTVSKAFYKKASVYGTSEFKELRSAMNDCPNFEIVFKTSDKKTYNGLSFERMEDYIRVTQSDSKSRLEELHLVMEVAEAKGAKYPLTKKWFLKNYPEYTESVCEDELKKRVESELTLLVESELNEVA